MTFKQQAMAALLLFSMLSPSFSTDATARQAASPAQSQTTTEPARPSAQTTPATVVGRIRDEGLNRSQVMQTLSYLTDIIGPRLTGSPELKRANNWTRDKLSAWGLQNAHLEAWGPFGRGWTLKRFSAEIVGPQSFPLLAYPRAWSPGLDAPLEAEVVYVNASNEEELQKYKGTLRGKIVLAGAVRESKPKFDPTARRLSEKQLLELAEAPDPATLPRRTPRVVTPEQIAAAKFNDRKTRFYYEEGVALLAGSSSAGDGSMLQFVHSASVPNAGDTPSARRVNSWDPKVPKLIPQIALSNDNYNRLMRMLEQGEKPRMAVRLEVNFQDDDLMSYNTIAEIPGSDLKDEVVMLGAHLDSWHTGTGATDNAAGVAMMMEAVRIIKALNLQPRRTIRIALWSGEEQGLLGSRAYVQKHLGPVEGGAVGVAPKFKPEYEKFNVYFNSDSGTGRIRGIFLQGNESLRPFFREWLAPLSELGASTITLSNSGGSDFLAFDAVGLPGLDFLQDDVEYEARTWHSNEDVYDRIVPEDMKQASVVVASVVYDAANAAQKLPRKPQKTNNSTP